MIPDVSLIRAILLQVLLFSSLSSATGSCQPHTWTKTGLSSADAHVATVTPEPAAFATVVSKFDNTNPRRFAAGDLHCREWSWPQKEVNYRTCAEIADYYDITIEDFFFLNPELKSDCSDIRTGYEYCVRGFIEPLRAWDGLCGPSNKNATCLGTDFGPCCNSKTSKCGDSEEDCAPGICYNGACAGDKVYSTDGTCGPNHGYRRCAGPWGDCCHFNGTCGTGESFCDVQFCQSGNCTHPFLTNTGSGLPWQTGNTTDGKCGGRYRFTCDVVYGNCCSWFGECGSERQHCNEGCQPQFGQCSSTVTCAPRSVPKVHPYYQIERFDWL